MLMFQPSLADLLPEVPAHPSHPRLAAATGAACALIGYGLAALAFPAAWRDAATGLHPVAWVGYGVAVGLGTFFVEAIIRCRRLQEQLAESAVDSERLQFFGIDRSASDGSECDSVAAAASQWHARLQCQWHAALVACLLVPVLVGMDGLLNGLRTDETLGIWSTCGGLFVGSLVFLLLWTLGAYGHWVWSAANDRCELLLRDYQRQHAAPPVPPQTVPPDPEPVAPALEDHGQLTADSPVPNEATDNDEASHQLSYLEQLENL